MNFKSLLKIFLSVLMIGLVIRLVSFHDLKQTLSSIPLSTTLAVIVIYGAGQVLSSFKWWLLARAAHVEVPYSAALKAYFVGAFFNCFGFSVVGGDVARGIVLAKDSKRKAAAMASVIADRVQGLAVLASIGAVAALVYGYQSIPAWVLLVLIGVVIGGASAWIIGPRVLLALIPEGTRLRQKAEEIAAIFPRSPTTMLGVTLLSTIFHLSQIWLHAVIAHGLGFDLSMRSLLLAVPFVNILASLPISWNGLGVRENSYVFFFKGLINYQQAVALGAIWLLGVMATSAVGGIVAFLTDDMTLVRREKDRVELSDSAALEGENA